MPWASVSSFSAAAVALQRTTTAEVARHLPAPRTRVVRNAALHAKALHVLAASDVISAQ